MNLALSEKEKIIEEIKWHNEQQQLGSEEEENTELDTNLLIKMPKANLRPFLSPKHHMPNPTNITGWAMVLSM